MILRVIALAFGVAGAAGLSQFPEFAQQYLQRLAGKVDQLEVQVIEIDAAAASFDMTRDAYLADLGTSRTGAAAAERARVEIALYVRLSTYLDGFRQAGAFGRLAQAYRVADVDLAQRTYGDYKPALPLTIEGLSFAALGFVAGWGIWSIFWAIVGWPFRRRRRRREAEEFARLAAHKSAETNDATFEEEEDDVPFVEYEGDIHAAMTQELPPLTLAAHDGTVVDLSMLKGPAVIVTFPLIGRPGEAFPKGWEEVDEADNATALACSFRDAFDMIRTAGIRDVFGVSTQDPGALAEAAHRLALPYTLLSDPKMSLSFALDLPRFILDHQRYMSPAVIVVQSGRILAALHPIKHAPTAAPRLLEKLEQAKAAHQEALTA
ncbi:MAG: DUF2937 family protein [Pseudomonadota bacterium]